MANLSFIKLGCDLPEREWYKDIKAKALFLHLLLRAGSTPGSWQGEPLKAGQLISSLKTEGEACGLSRQEARTAARRLEESGELLVHTAGKHTLFELVNSPEHWNLSSDVPTTYSTTYSTTSNQHGELGFCEENEGEPTTYPTTYAAECILPDEGKTGGDHAPELGIYGKSEGCLAATSNDVPTTYSTTSNQRGKLGFCGENKGEPTTYPTTYAAFPENEAEKQAGAENIYNIYSSSSVEESLKNLDNNIYITPSVTESINKKKNIPPYICPPKVSEAENECENSAKDSAAPGKAKGKSALKPPSREELIAVIRECTANEEVQEAAIGWLDMRISRKATPTERAIRLAFAEVRRATQDADVAVAMFNRSTLNNWKGVFPLEGSR